jgi:hypothetical protein
MDQCCPSDGCDHSVTSAHVDLRIDNNGTWQDAFQFGTPDDTSWTLTGQAFELDVQRSPYDLVPLLHMDSAGGQIVIDDVVQRVIHFNVPPSDLQANLSPGTYVYDLVMVNGSNVRVPMMHGALIVAQGITYPAGP